MAKNNDSPIRPASLAVFTTVFGAVFVLVVLTATLVTFILPESFASSARIKLDPKATSGTGTSGAEAGATAYDPYLLQTQMEILRSELVLKPVIEGLDLNTTWGKRYLMGNEKLKTPETLQLLKKRLDIRPVRSTTLVEIQAFSEVPTEAADIANAIAKSYATYTASNPNGVQSRLVDTAVPGLRPVRPNKPVNIASGVIIGAILGLIAGSIALGIAQWWGRRTQRPPPIP